MQIDSTQDAPRAENPDLGGSPGEAVPRPPEESWTIETLEADVAAVGSAMETVDRIVAGVASSEGSVGSAAAEIIAVVSQQRFGTPGPVGS